jgi:hypothetical protein
MVQQVWCDESGFTGNKLLDRQQPLFVYCSVAISATEAAELIAMLAKDGSVQGEVKAAKLLRYNQGRKAIERLVREIDGRFCVSFYEKKFALACKFFEYIFEPVLSAKSSFFYEIKFHKFIANLLYIHFGAQRRSAEEIFEEFEQSMRNLDDQRLHRLLLRGDLARDAISLQPVVDFGILNFQAIRDEMDVLRGDGVGKWVLDLTSSALYSHLGLWGDKFDTLDVYCDSSKPIAESFPLGAFVGQDEKVYTTISGEPHLLTPNLARPIELRDSRGNPGLQVADIVAGAGLNVFTELDSGMGAIRSQIAAAVSTDSVLPEPDDYLTGNSARLHSRILTGLVRRSRDGRPLLEDLENLAK